VCEPNNDVAALHCFRYVTLRSPSVVTLRFISHYVYPFAHVNVAYSPDPVIAPPHAPQIQLRLTIVHLYLLLVSFSYSLSEPVNINAIKATISALLISCC